MKWNDKPLDKSIGTKSDEDDSIEVRSKERVWCFAPPERGNWATEPDVKSIQERQRRACRACLRIADSCLKVFEAHGKDRTLLGVTDRYCIAFINRRVVRIASREANQ